MYHRKTHIYFQLYGKNRLGSQWTFSYDKASVISTSVISCYFHLYLAESISIPAVFCLLNVRSLSNQSFSFQDFIWSKHIVSLWDVVKPCLLSTANFQTFHNPSPLSGFNITVCILGYFSIDFAVLPCHVLQLNLITLLTFNIMWTLWHNQRHALDLVLSYDVSLNNIDLPFFVVNDHKAVIIHTYFYNLLTCRVSEMFLGASACNSLNLTQWKSYCIISMVNVILFLMTLPE